MSASESNFYENAEIISSSESVGGFDEPPTMEGQARESDSEFDPPPIGDGGDDGGGDGGDGGVETSAAAQRVREVKEAIEQRLMEAAASNAFSLASARNIDSAGVLGVGLSGGVVPGQPSLVVYVESEANEEQVRREIVDTMGVRAASSDDLSVEVEVTGPIEAYTTNRSRFRPAPAGVSVGHFRITAGTIGGWSRGRSVDRQRRLLMVSS